MARRVLETGLKVIIEELPNITIDPGKKTEIVHGILHGPRELLVTTH